MMSEHHCISEHLWRAAGVGLLLVLTLTSALDAQVKPRRPAPVRASPLLVPAPKAEEPAKVYPGCPQPHAGRTYRVRRLARDGDAKILRSIAGHTVIYARERYGIADITTDADFSHAQTEMYQYLSWKIGNPSLVAAQWISAGYQHFDHHADEAAAALLGMELPGPGPQVRLPEELSAWLQAQVDSLQNDGEGNSICASLGDSTFVGFGCEVLLPFVQEAIEQSIDRIGISSAAIIGKNKYDVTDPEIELAIYVRRNPVVWPREGLPTLRKRPRSGGAPPDGAQGRY